MAKDFYGMDDPMFYTAFVGLIEITGEKAFESLYKIFSRIGQKRFDAFKTLLEPIEFFGSRIAFVHKDDLEGREVYKYGCTSPKCKTDKETCQGFFSPHDFWIEVALHNVSSFGMLEEVIRHEVIHLLQEITKAKCENGRPLPGEDLHLLTDSVKWGSGLANTFREHAEENDFEVFEVEAYSMQTWKASVKDWSSEIMKNEALWLGHACSIID